MGMRIWAVVAGILFVAGISLALGAGGTNCSLEGALIAGAGARAVDCSRDQVPHDVEDIFIASECVVSSLANGQAFHARYTTLFRDSYGETGYFGTGDGAVAKLRYDRIFYHAADVAYERIWRDDCPQQSVVVPTQWSPKRYPPVECGDWVRAEEMCESDRFWLLAKYYRQELYHFFRTYVVQGGL